VVASTGAREDQLHGDAVLQVPGALGIEALGELVKGAQIHARFAFNIVMPLSVVGVGQGEQGQGARLITSQSSREFVAVLLRAVSQRIQALVRYPVCQLLVPLLQLHRRTRRRDRLLDLVELLHDRRRRGLEAVQSPEDNLVRLLAG
jgi:hypothetical protein